MPDSFLYPLPQTLEAFRDFFAHYECQNILTFPQNEPPTLNRNNRVCRFCGLDSSKTTFKKRAHIAPVLLGNKHGISDFECDTCNEHFCTYESHLAYYLGLNQTFAGSVSRKNIPTLKSAKKDLEIRAMNFFGVDGIMIQKTSTESKAIDWSEDDIVSITFLKGSYKPLYVFKILFKIALCSLPESEVPKYKVAFDYITKENVSPLNGMANIGVYEFKIGFAHPIPFGYLFKKKIENADIPTHQFAFYFQNRIITFCLPYNIEDWKQGLYDGKSRNIPVAPPLATTQIKENIPFNFIQTDLSSKDPVKGEEQVITFQVNKEQIKNAMQLDPITGKLSEREIVRDKPKGIFLVPPNTVIKPEAFKQYVKEST